MSRPIQLTAAQLLKAIGPSPLKPSELAIALGVSRATVHRRLEDLLTEQLVIRVGEVPQAAYRLPTSAEVQAQAQVSSLAGQVRMGMGRATAVAVRSGLELFCRLGIGQLGEIAHETSVVDGKPISGAVRDEVESLCESLKAQMLGLPSGASFGIYSPKVHVDVRRAWSLMKALRHRQAWDLSAQATDAHLGVWHDEPTRIGEQIPGLAVFSEARSADGELTRYFMEMPRDCVELVGLAVNYSLRVQLGDVQSVVDMAKEGYLSHESGRAISADELQIASAIAQRASNALRETRADGSLDQALSPLQARMLRVVKACEAFDSAEGYQPEEQSAEFVTFEDVAPGSARPVSVADLPDGMLLNHKDGQYRVVAPTGEDQVLTIIAESHSLQTAILKARKKAAGALPGAF